MWQRRKPGRFYFVEGRSLACLCHEKLRLLKVIFDHRTFTTRTRSGVAAFIARLKCHNRYIIVKNILFRNRSSFSVPFNVIAINSNKTC